MHLTFLRKKPSDEAFQASFKSPRCRSEQMLADFNRFFALESTGLLLLFSIISPWFAISFCYSQKKQINNNTIYKKRKNVRLPILINKSLQFHYFEKRIRQSYFSYFCPKTLVGFCLNSFCLIMPLFRTNFNRKSTVSQYLNPG